MTRNEMISGYRAAIPIMLGSIPFALLFGTVAAERGLSVGEIVLMSLTMYAGASQLVGIELFQHRVAPWLIILSVLAVNFRHVLYSASIAKHLGRFTPFQKAFGLFFLVDGLFAEGVRRAETGTKLTFAWYMGFGLAVYLPWQIATWIGAVFGAMIGDPRIWGMDLLLAIFFMGMVLGFRHKDNWLPIVGASGATSVLAWHLIGSPWHISVGAIAGIALAAFMPLRTEAGE